MKVLLWLFLLGLWAGAVRAAEEAPVPEPTTIDSQSLRMQGYADRNVFFFDGEVVVTGENLRVECEEMEVVALRSGESEEEAAEGTVGNLGKIQSIVARGRVVIRQAGRTAYAQKAVLAPEQGEVVLTGDPRVVDDADPDFAVRGREITLKKGRRQVFVEEPFVTFGPLTDLGFERDGEKEEEDVSAQELIEENLPQEDGEDFAQ